MLRYLAALVVVLIAAASALTIPAASVEYLANNPSEFNANIRNFNARYSSALTVAANSKSLVDQGAPAAPDTSGKRGILVSWPPVGTSWPGWYKSTFQVGNSSFNLGVYGARDASRVDLTTVPCIHAVDPVRGYFFLNDPVAGQLTTPNASYIWFPNPIDGSYTCFVNRTAGFVSQQTSHAAVTLNTIDNTLLAKVKVGNFYLDVPVPFWHAFGLTGDFGKTHLGSMPFWADVDPLNRTLRLGFDQPEVTAQIPYGSGNCPVELTRVVGGRYSFIGKNNAILPLSAAPANIFTADASCYVDGNPAKGFSPFLPDYDSAVCGRC